MRVAFSIVWIFACYFGLMALRYGLYGTTDWTGPK